MINMRKTFWLPALILPFLFVLVFTGCGALETTAPAPKATGSTSISKPYPTAHVQRNNTVYSNALNAATSGWASGSTCMFTGNGLSVHPNSGQAYICLAPTPALSDTSIRVTTQQQAGATTHAYGIAFRHASSHNYYFFGIDGRGRFILTIVVNDVSHTVIPFTHNPAIHTGNASNTLQVTMKGQTATLFVNDSPVGQATLTTFAHGTVGVRGISDGTVLFRQLSIVTV
jgi:hypothetical protein